MQEKRGATTTTGPKSSFIKLETASLELLKRYIDLIVSHKLIAESLENEMQRYLRETYGADTAKDNWSIDLQSGLLEITGKAG